MATKQVTIKDTNSDTLHPVTDSDVVYVGNNSLTSELSDAVHFDTVAPATAVDPITTSMIANEAVTASKIDWSSMPTPIIVTISSNIARNTSSAWATEDFYSKQKTFDAGKYLILAMFRISNSSSGDKWIDVKVGNTGNLCNQGFQSGAGSMQGVSAFDFIDIQTSGTYAVTFQAGSEVNNTPMVLYNGSKIAFIKIG